MREKEIMKNYCYYTGIIAVVPMVLINASTDGCKKAQLKGEASNTKGFQNPLYNEK